MNSYHQHQSCIDACLRYAAVCNHCAASCTQEEDVKMMAACIRLDMECAAICIASAQLMSLGSEHAAELCQICATVCEQCAAECMKHDNEHCQECSRICYMCADECRQMMAAA